MTPDELRRFRKDLGLSQSQFAKMVGASSDRTVRRWEDGERDIPAYIEIIADLIDRSTDAARILMERIK